MSRIDLAKKTGLTRETVRLFLQENSNPRTSTVSKIASSLGYHIHLKPINAKPQKTSISGTFQKPKSRPTESL